jgi:hypothetical protein
MKSRLRRRRSLLMRLAVHELIQAKWSVKIHEKWMTAVLRDRLDLTLLQLQRTLHFMQSFVEADSKDDAFGKKKVGWKGFFLQGDLSKYWRPTFWSVGGRKSPFDRLKSPSEGEKGSFDRLKGRSKGEKSPSDRLKGPSEGEKDPSDRLKGRFEGVFKGQYPASG